MADMNNRFQGEVIETTYPGVATVKLDNGEVVEMTYMSGYGPSPVNVGDKVTVVAKFEFVPPKSTR